HLTIHFNGWVDGAPNPRDFTTDRKFHSRFETLYVNAALDVPRVRAKGRAPERLPNVWDSIKQYLNQSLSDVQVTYELEKSGDFDPDKPSTKGTEFIAAEMARAS